MSLLMVANAQANSVTVTWADNHSPEGGAFTMTPNNGLAFNTFCVEMNQYVNVGSTYTYVVANAADGGVANYNNGNVTSGGPDPVSIGSAWLYSSFRNGTLPGFTGTEQQQEQLQNTFWYLENEITDRSGTGNYLSLVQSALPGVDLMSDANGAYGVDVWNLFDGDGNPCQSQLGIQSVPEGGSTLLMGFIGCGLLIGLRRKLAVA